MRNESLLPARGRRNEIRIRVSRRRAGPNPHRRTRGSDQFPHQAAVHVFHAHAERARDQFVNDGLVRQAVRVEVIQHRRAVGDHGRGARTLLGIARQFPDHRASVDKCLHMQLHQVTWCYRGGYTLTVVNTFLGQVRPLSNR